MMVYNENSIDGMRIRDYLINWHTIDEVIRDFWFQDKKDFLESYNIKAVIEDLISYWNSIWEISNLIWMSIEDINWLFQSWYNRRIEFQWWVNQADPFDDDDDWDDDEELEDEEKRRKKLIEIRRRAFNQHMKERRINNNINYILNQLRKGKSIKGIASSAWLDPYEFLADYYSIFEKYAKENWTTIKILFENGGGYYVSEDNDFY